MSNGIEKIVDEGIFTLFICVELVIWVVSAIFGKIFFKKDSLTKRKTISSFSSSQYDPLRKTAGSLLQAGYRLDPCPQ